MKKLIDVPLIVEMSDWHSLTAYFADEKIKKRLVQAVDREFYLLQLEAENISYNVAKFSDETEAV